MTAAASFYVTGGTLRQDAPSYVERQADKDLYEGLLHGEFCYVLTSRQMGKSSLMAHTAARLRQEGVAVAVLDLTAIGQNLSPEQWYDGLLRRVGRPLDLEDELEEFWLEQERLGPLERWLAALEKIVLPALREGQRLVIFIDEIDAVRSLPFSTDEFFAAIRECYNRRTQDPAFEQVTFCLLGVATPSDLIQDTRVTPFNVGQRIELTDFSPAEAAPLAQGLGRDEQEGRNLLERVLDWTGGHPYLTQRFCLAVARDPAVQSLASVDRLCAELFLSPSAQEKDDNLLFVRERLLHNEADRAGLLDLYGRVRAGKRVGVDDTNQLVSILRLSGVTRLAGGDLQVRNRIYERVFDRAWVTQHMPDAELRRQRAAYRRGLVRATSVAVLFMTVMAVLSGWALSNAAAAREAGHRAAVNEAVAKRQAARLAGQAQELRRQGKSLLTLAQRLQTALAKAKRESGRANREASTAKSAQGKAERSRLAAQGAQERAERQQQVAEHQRRRAVHEQHVAEERLVRMNVATGNRLEDDGDLLGALPWFVEALRLDQRQPERAAMDRTRLAAALQQRPRLVQLWMHGGPVTGGAFSPDGRRVVTASQDGTARVWDVTTGRALLPLLKHPASVLQAEFSADGRRVLTRSADGLARVWDLTTGRVAFPALKHKAAINFALFSPDSHKIATASADRTAQIWDAAAGRPLGPPLQHDASVNEVSFSPDGRRLATTSDDGTARVWDIATGTLLTSTQNRGIRHARFSPDGGRLVTSGDSNSAMLWDTKTGQAIGLPLLHTSWVLNAEFSPDARRVVTAGADERARVWNADTGQAISPPMKQGGHVARATFSPDGAYVLATGSAPARVWDATTGEPAGPPMPQSELATFSPDGRQILTMSADGTARVWDLARSESQAPDLYVGGIVNYAAFTPDGQRILAISGGVGTGAAGMWDVAKGRLVSKEMPFDNPLYQDRRIKPALSPDGHRVLTTRGDRMAQLWDAATGNPVGTPLEHKGRLRALSFSPDGRRVVTTSDDKTARLWDAATGKALTAPMEHPGPVAFAVFSPDSRRVVTACADGTARVWNAATGRPAAPPITPGAPVTYACFSPDGRRVATASSDRTTRVWDAATGRPVTPVIQQSAEVSTVEFSPDGRRLLTLMGLQGIIQVWDAATGKPVTPLMKHGNVVSSARFSPGGHYLLTGSWDFTARVWDATTGEPITPPVRHPNRVHDAEFSPDGRRIVTACQDGRVRVWDLPREDRPLTDLRLMARLLADQQIRESSGVMTADLAMQRQDWQLLRSRYSADFAASPGEGLAWHRHEAEVRERDRQWSVALFHRDQLLQLQPTDWKGRIARAYDLAQLNRRAEALVELAKADELRPAGPEYWSALGGAYYELGEWNRALPAYSQAIEREPARWEHRYERAFVYAELGQWENASADFSRAIQLQASPAWTWYFLAAAQWAAGDTEGYSRTYADALARFGSTGTPSAAYYVAGIAALSPSTGIDRTRAIQLAEKALAAFPGYYGHSRLGSVLCRAGRYDEAVQRLNEADSGQPPDGEARHEFWLALCHARLGHAAEARQWLEKGTRWLDQALQRKPEENPLRWDERLLLQQLQREADALLPPSKG